jgi:ATP-dependent Clp protease ATP-binding subunit ClpA
VSKQAAHKRFSVDSQDPALRRFTPRARSVLRAATEAARSLGHGEVGTEHLLLGLFESAGSIAAQVLSEAGITRAEVGGRIGNANAAPRASATVEDPPFSPRGAAAIEQAVTEALSLGHNYVGTEHLLLALFGDSEDLAAAILADLGAQRDEFRKQILQKLAAYSGR